jgi:hypothetical protein
MNLELWSFSAGLGGGELRGMSVEALDGTVGTVKDVVNQPGGAYLVVDTGRWIFGRTVMLPAGVVRAVEHDRRCVFVACSQEHVKNAPEHDPDASDGAARAALTAHYGDLRQPDDHAERGAATAPVSDAALTPRPADGTAVPSAPETAVAPPGRDTGQRTDTDSVPAARSSDRPPADIPSASGPTSLNQPSGASADAEREDESGQASPRVDVSSHDTQAPSMPAPEAAASASDSGAGRQDGAAPTGRFTRGSGDRSSRSEGTSGSADRSSDNKSARTSSGEPPIARYDTLTAAEVIARLRSLSQRELASLERYEKRHHDRQTVLSRIDSLREDEPWRGYDDATVPEIRRALADADEDRAKAVRDYERRHRDRKGVMEAARRAVANL